MPFARPGVIDLLNGQLRSEVQAINQYTLWGLQAIEWGFPAIKELLDKILEDEYDHRKLCIERVLRLGGDPDVAIAAPVVPASGVPEILQTGIRLESEAVLYLNPAINHCQTVSDNTTANMLTEILGDEEKHLSWFERELRAQETLGLALYLAGQRD